MSSIYALQVVEGPAENLEGEGWFQLFGEEIKPSTFGRWLEQEVS